MLGILFSKVELRSVVLSTENSDHLFSEDAIKAEE